MFQVNAHHHQDCTFGLYPASVIKGSSLPMSFPPPPKSLWLNTPASPPGVSLGLDLCIARQGQCERSLRRSTKYSNVLSKNTD